jgi:hypothetical protein
MLTALRDHPEWQGSRLFLANRLASLRLVLGEGWPRSKEDKDKKRVPVWTVGELLDYLARSAAFRWWPLPARKAELRGDHIICALCHQPFPRYDRRRVYCGDCRNQLHFERLAAAIRSQRHRAAHPH